MRFLEVFKQCCSSFTVKIEADGDTPCEFCHKTILRKEIIESRNQRYFHLRCAEEIDKKNEGAESQGAFDTSRQWQRSTPRHIPSDYNNPNAGESEPGSDYL